MATETIRVLVVDDSAYMRKAVREMLESSPRIEVIGTAYNGEDALEKVEALKPDVVTVDLYMSGLDGVAFIREQMRRQPLPIVVCSSASESGTEVLEAMEEGAIEFVQKPTAQALDRVLNIRAQLVETVTAASQVPFEKLAPAFTSPAILPDPLFSHNDHPLALGKGQVDAVLIGISTGGPRALRQIMPLFPRDFPVPIAIVLHMPVGYTRPLAEKLNEISRIEVLESEDRVEMLPGRAILAQAGIHTRLEKRADGRVFTRLSRDPAEGLYHPSVDELFRSGAQVYGGHLLGVVMTGMGEDGKAGAAWIKAAGGQIFAEDESTTIVFGMPRAIIEAGLADRVLPLTHLAQGIMEVIV